MKRLFYGVILLHLILWVSCTGSPRFREVKEPESPAELLSDSSLTDFDFEGNWRWCWVDSHTIVSMKILTDKDSIGDYVYTYYFGNRIEQGKVKLLSQEGRNAVLLVEYNDHRSWSAKFNYPVGDKNVILSCSVTLRDNSDDTTGLEDILLAALQQLKVEIK